MKKRRGRSVGSSGINWIEAAANPWGVPVLDVRPVTLGMQSFSADPRCAENAISFEQDDGTSFVGNEPPSDRLVEAGLAFPIDRVLADGVLFTPSEMEQKWAIFHHRGEILCVRSWLRKVQVVAHAEPRGDHVEITSIRGWFDGNDEAPEFTIAALDFLLRTHALGEIHPAPLPSRIEADPEQAALWCRSMFGNLASFATPHRFDRTVPAEPLRTISLLHIAVARGDVERIDEELRAGVPIDLIGADGLTPLHWALSSASPSMVELLLRRGSPVDVRSAEGATPLMHAVQNRNPAQAELLLDHGAEANAADARGYTALHRAAEMGEFDLVRLLLERGAAPDPTAQGRTPRSLAADRRQRKIVALLDRWLRA